MFLLCNKTLWTVNWVKFRHWCDRTDNAPSAALAVQSLRCERLDDIQDTQLFAAQARDFGNISSLTVVAIWWWGRIWDRSLVTCPCQRLWVSHRCPENRLLAMCFALLNKRETHLIHHCIGEGIVMFRELFRWCQEQSLRFLICDILFGNEFR